MTTPDPIPLHAVPDLAGRRFRGRPKKAVPAPTFDERLYYEQVAALRADALSVDPLVLAADARADALDHAITEIAIEAASLRWERERAEERGLEKTPMISSRIVDAYSKLSSLILQQHELRRGEPTDAQIERVRGMFLDEVEANVVAVLGAEVAAAFMSKLQERIATDESGPR